MWPTDTCGGEGIRADRSGPRREDRQLSARSFMGCRCVGIQVPDRSTECRIAQGVAMRGRPRPSGAEKSCVGVAGAP